MFLRHFGGINFPLEVLVLTDSLARTSSDAVGRRRMMLAVLIAAGALTILDVSKVGVAIPVIQTSFGDAGEVAVQLMMIGYTLAYAAFLLPSGRLGDMISRRRLFLGGLSVFVLASVVCGLAANPWWLVVGRVVQGAGAGILMPQVIGLIQRLYGVEERGRPLAALAVTTSITSALGPVLAGVIMQLAGGPDSWRWLFWVNVVVGAVLLPIAFRVVGDVRSERRRGFDGLGTGLLVAAVILTVFPLGAVSEDTGAPWWLPLPIVVGIGFGVAFVLYELRRSHGGLEPLLDLAMFRFAHFGTGLGIAGLMHASGTSSSLILTLFLQQSAGLSPLQTAITMVFTAVAVTVSASLTGRLPAARSWSLIWLGASISALTLASIAILLATVPAASMVPLCTILLFVNGIGTGMISAPNQSRTLSGVPDYRASVAGSSIQLFQRLGSAAGMAVAMIAYFGLGGGGPADVSPGASVALGLCACYLVATALLALVENRRSHLGAPMYS